MIFDLLPQNWRTLLYDELQKPYIKELEQFLLDEYKNHTVYPSMENLFNAFKLCDFDKLKIVIIGQDPYINPHQAHGLAFSVLEPTPPPPSLKNIFKELQDDLGVVAQTTNLSHWASQGVLLLNAIMSVREGESLSHQKRGWESFSDSVLKVINDRKENIVFILWGSYAIKKGLFLDDSKHLVIKSPHPSPLSAHRGFFGSKPFSKTNEYLKYHSKDVIEW